MLSLSQSSLQEIPGYSTVEFKSAQMSLVHEYALRILALLGDSAGDFVLPRDVHDSSHAEDFKHTFLCSIQCLSFPAAQEAAYGTNFPDHDLDVFF